MPHLDRLRAERLMSNAGIDALILLSPENFIYATGASSGVATMWRRAGAVAALVPADANMPETAVVSDLFAKNFSKTSPIEDVRESPIWVETSALDNIPPDGEPAELIRSGWKDEGRSDGFSRPTTFDPSICYRHLVDALTERGLSKSRIGFEGAAVSVHDYSALKNTFDNIELVDATDLIAKLKMVKSAGEVDNLRQAVDIAESGICAIRDAISVGITRNELALVWSNEIHTHPNNSALSGSWEYVSVGSDPWGGNAAAKSGDLIKVDVGCLVEGYSSDSARTFVLGSPTQVQTQIYKALTQGFIAGSKMLQPGVPLSDVHRATLDAIRSSGFPGYTRGHFGHGLGAGLGSEEWPFISADATVNLEPGMVMAFECPWYINGLGGFIIENQLLITESGHQMMNSLPLDLVEIAV